MTTLMAPNVPGPPKSSNLTKQLEYQHDGDELLTPKANKTRSFSDVPSKPTLSPSPAFRERRDTTSSTDPVTPQRNHVRGLSLQMPLKDGQDGASPSVPRVPVSPKLEPSNVYGSPASVLPRRSRGLDFARASTNLHQTTLAESSPDASPITGRGINIPQRRILGQNSVLDSPSQQPWMSMPGEKTNLSSSVSSINMMDSDSDSDDSSEDMAMDREMDDPMLNTPAAARINGLAVHQSPGLEWLNNAGPANTQISLLNFTPNRLSFRRARLKNNKSSHSSSSVSMRSSRPSPGPLSPPIRPSVEGSNYFGLTKQQVRSRRESLSLGTDDLQLSDSEWEDNSKMNSMNNQGHELPGERGGVIRRAVTRRSNLLPKSKGFSRIKAALMEESDPLRTEARKEAEVVKQVQESDAYSTAQNILGTPTTAEPVEASIELQSSTDLSQQASNDSDTANVPPTEPFSKQAKRHSGGLGFWNNFDHTPPNIDRYRTPPPPSLYPQDSADSDAAMASTPNFHESGNTGSLIRHLHRSRSRSTTPLASQNGNNPPTAGDVARKVNNKRRRDDDFDPASFKRRAVSPGMMGSTQSSPVVPQSPTLNADKAWGRPPPKTHADRSNSNGSVSGGPKRVGLQGMTEASDGFMSMSID